MSEILRDKSAEEVKALALSNLTEAISLFVYAPTLDIYYKILLQFLESLKMADPKKMKNINKKEARVDGAALLPLLAVKSASEIHDWLKDEGRIIVATKAKMTILINGAGTAPKLSEFVQSLAVGMFNSNKFRTRVLLVHERGFEPPRE